MSKEIMQQALDALEDCYPFLHSDEVVNIRLKAIAALEAELSKPEKYDQTTLELCDKCGWRTLIPDDCCLNCERNQVEKEKLCVNCGKPTMHIGSKCYGCCQTAQPEQEPVAWHSHNPDYPIQDGDWVEVIFTSGQPDDAKKWTPLYTAPSKPEQEPAAIVDDEGFAWGYGIEGGRLPSGTKVYTAPQNPDVTLISEGKTWQGLTDDEMMEPWPFETRIEFVRWIENKLREKNT